MHVSWILSLLRVERIKAPLKVLVDVDGWGQVIILNTLTRYARSQFTDPNLAEGAAEEDSVNFYSSSSSEVSFFGRGLDPL